MDILYVQLFKRSFILLFSVFPGNRAIVTKEDADRLEMKGVERV